MRRLFSVLLAAAMLVALTGTSALAEKPDGWKACAEAEGMKPGEFVNYLKDIWGGFDGQHNMDAKMFVIGTEGDDDFDALSEPGVPQVFCGLGGNDVIGVPPYFLESGDVFFGGPGDDLVWWYSEEGAVFVGGAGLDQVWDNFGTFHGGDGDDRVNGNNPGIFYGGVGNDFVQSNSYDYYGSGPGSFYGGAGADFVAYNHAYYSGGDGPDHVVYNWGTFDGGPGVDSYGSNIGGTLIDVP